MIKILGLDPGKTTGWAVIHVNEMAGSRTISPTLKYGETKDMTLGDIQEHIVAADVICYEGWRTFKKEAERGALNYQKVYAEQVIGAMNTLLRVLNLSPKVHENLSNAKKVGYGYWGVKQPKGSGDGVHWKDAMSHAIWFAVAKLGARPPSSVCS